MTLLNKLYIDSNPKSSPNQGRIQGAEKFCQYEKHWMLVSSEVHVGVTGRGAIGPRLVDFDGFSASFQMYLLYHFC
jgi:hypothetical protein